MTTRRGLFGLMAGAAVAPFLPESAWAPTPVEGAQIGDLFTMEGVYAPDGAMREFVVTGRTVERHSWRDGMFSIEPVPLADYYARADTS